MSPQSETYPAPTVPPPDEDELLHWYDAGICQATDGCWVEPDGICEHGHPSWLLYWDLI